MQGQEKLVATTGFAVIALSFAAPANAACRTQAPPVMYLGANAVYDIALELNAGDRCVIDYVERGDRVAFQTLKPIREPETGKLLRVSDFVFDFVPDTASRSDYFTLKLCGTDVKGSGCSTLRYTATVK